MKRCMMKKNHTYTFCRWQFGYKVSLLCQITLTHPSVQSNNRQHDSSEVLISTSSSLPLPVSDESSLPDSTAHNDPLNQTMLSKSQEAGYSNSPYSTVHADTTSMNTKDT